MTDDEENLFVQTHVSRATNEDDQTARLNFALAKVRERARIEGAKVERERIVAIVVAHREWASDNGRFRKDERDLIVGVCNAILKELRDG